VKHGAVPVLGVLRSESVRVECDEWELICRLVGPPSKQEVALSALERANQTPVSPELFVEAMELFAEMPCEEEQSVFDVRTLRLVDFLRAKGFSGRHHADLVVAIIFRSYALAHLVRCEPVNGWIISAEERGMTRLHAEVISAAAEEALVEDPDSVATFDVRSFARRILHLAQPQGRA
jgi:hypothetical protein